MRNKHVTRFGHPSAQGGALYHVSDQEGLVLAALDVDLARLLTAGHVPTTRDAREILARMRHAQSAFNTSMSARGIPPAIATLLSTDHKPSAERIARTLEIAEHDLFQLVHNCIQRGLTCRSKFPEFVPEHLQITRDDRDRLAQGALAKFSRKMASLFSFRKNTHVHLFENAQEWHCFYFTYRDIEEATNHWKHGPHIHYVSHHWPMLSANIVWDSFDRRIMSISGSVHIRFRPYDYNQATLPSGLQSTPTEDTFFPTDPSPLEANYPTPPGQLATRGGWTATIYAPIST